MAALLMALVVIAFVVLVIAGIWKTFEKAGQPGWAAIIPIYNVYIITQIAGRSGWWTLLACLPYVGIIFFIILSLDVAKNFGKGAGFGVGLALLGMIFWPILGFGDAQYLAGERRGFAVEPPRAQ